ncbi:MAG: hypothetical protein OEY36_13735 [Gammaproteobacteria bacterium]|nr:hypothetical protein [Gammaproteobacteria bacterium]
MRRIKHASITIPCVTGPYTNINCKVILQNHRIRISSDVTEGYAEKVDNDSRFKRDWASSRQNIATSSANNDSGLFEVNLSGSQYLPFEGAGVISNWGLELPKDTNHFNYNTITDVLLTIRYTAREDDSGVLRVQCEKERMGMFKSYVEANKVIKILSLKNDMPDHWQNLIKNNIDIKNNDVINIAPDLVSGVARVYVEQEGIVESLVLGNAWPILKNTSADDVISVNIVPASYLWEDISQNFDNKTVSDLLDIWIEIKIP